MTARVVAPLSATLSARMSARLASAALTAACLLSALSMTQSAVCPAPSSTRILSPALRRST